MTNELLDQMEKITKFISSHIYIRYGLLDCKINRKENTLVYSIMGNNTIFNELLIEYNYANKSIIISRHIVYYIPGGAMKEVERMLKELTRIHEGKYI